MKDPWAYPKLSFFLQKWKSKQQTRRVDIKVIRWPEDRLRLISQPISKSETCELPLHSGSVCFKLFIRKRFWYGIMIDCRRSTHSCLTIKWWHAVLCSLGYHVPPTSMLNKHDVPLCLTGETRISGITISCAGVKTLQVFSSTPSKLSADSQPVGFSKRMQFYMCCMGDTDFIRNFAYS